MSTNPFAAPQSDLSRPDALPFDSKTRAVGLAQRQLMKAILLLLFCNFGAAFLSSADPSAGPSPALAIAAFIVLGAAIIASVLVLVSVWTLCRALGYSWPWSILLILLCFIPLFGFLVMLLLSGRATRRLSAAGVKVGLLGPRVADLPAEGPPPIPRIAE